MTSPNHPCMNNGVMEWLFNTVAGIDSRHAGCVPGFKHIIIKPLLDPSARITRAKANYKSIRGEIVSDWKYQGQWDIPSGAPTEFHLKVTIPPNTSGTVYIPYPYNDDFYYNITPSSSGNGVTVRSDLGSGIFDIGSGHYEFVSQKKP